MGFRLFSSAVLTILLAGSWCLAQISSNWFWLPMSPRTYACHIGVWVLVFLSIAAVLSLVARKSPRVENKLLLFLLFLSPVHLLDYGVRSVWGNVGDWPAPVLIGWASLTLLLVVSGAFIAVWYEPDRRILARLLQVAVIPCLLLLYHGRPGGFATMRVERPVVKKNACPPVHLMVFDMLSVDFLMEGGEIGEEFPCFREFAGRSTVFSDAHSGATRTLASVRRMLEGDSFRRIAFPHADSIAAASSGSMFCDMKAAGYNVFVAGFCLPYPDAYPDCIQQGRVYPFNTLWRLGMHSVYWPVVSPGGIHHRKMTRAMCGDYIQRIRNGHENTCFFVHWTIPHDPFIYDGNGNELSRFELAVRVIMGSDRARAYRDQLTGTDAVFGKTIRAMKERGTFEQGLIIVTADHNIRGFGYDMTHIPLIIKRPFQQDSETDSSRVSTWAMRLFLRRFIESGEADYALLQFTPQ